MKRAFLCSIVTLSLLEVSAPALAKETDSRRKGSEQGSARAEAAGAAKKPIATARPASTKKSATPLPGTAKISKAGASSTTTAKKPRLAKRTKTPRTCYARPVQLVRVRGAEVEPHELSLTLCSGRANLKALDELSILARPRDVDRPTASEVNAYRARPVANKANRKSGKKLRNPAFVTDRVMRVNPGLLVRLQRVANRYPGKIIEVISGYRPDARETSRHHHGRALDLRVAGVTRERLVTFLRGFEDTGVGYYPNSYFVHMDVRDEKAYWVDRSGPGEPADYGPWPVKKHPLDPPREKVVKGAIAALAALNEPVTFAQASPRTPVAKRAPVQQPEEERDDMAQDEVQRVRAEARRALEHL